MNGQQCDDNELSIRDILKYMFKWKYAIVLFVAVVCVSTVFAVIRMDNIYMSNAVLKPNNNNGDKMSSMLANFGGIASIAGISTPGFSAEVSPFNVMNSILRNGNFMADFVRKNNFQSRIFDDYDKIKTEDGFKKNEAYYIKKEMRKNIQFSDDVKTGIISISFTNKDRFFTKTFIDTLLKELSLKYKDMELKNIQQQIDNYKEEIDKTQDISVKNNLAEIVSRLIQNKIFSQAQQYYGFEIISNAAVSDPLDKVKPRRAVICIIAFILSLAVSGAAAVLYERYKADSRIS